MAESKRSRLPLIGWREWVKFPDLGIEQVKAKIDTGARSSALYAFDVEYLQAGDRQLVQFKVHPLQKQTTDVRTVQAELLEQRQVKNSGGTIELRPVILTRVSFRDVEWPIELTLTHRKNMQFRMLLGREAIRNRFLVDTGRSYLQSDKLPNS
ncbi:MAG: RimK/LysX family protein [Leptolyngbyaceae bacterium]|nr:RimK/LysX family protein [Leptolyngbyaceae bacterium]